MAKTVTKGFMYYLCIFASIIIGGLCIFLAILIFNPGQDIYGLGISYVSYTRDDRYTKLKDSPIFDQGGIDQINVTTDRALVSIEYSTYLSNFSVSFDRKVNGIAKTSKQDLNIDIKYNNKILDITTIEPDMIITGGNSIVVKLICPKGFSLSNTDVKITTNSGGIYVGDSEHNTPIKNLTIESKSGNIALNQKLNVTSGIVNIKSETSRIDIYSNIANSLNIEQKKGRITLGDTNGNVSIANTDVLEANISKISGSLEVVTSQNGYLNVNELSGNLTATNMNNTNVNINKILGEAVITTTGGNVYIQESRGGCNITTGGGNVNLISLFNTCTVKTNSGDIGITSNSPAGKIISATTESGDIGLNILAISRVDLTTNKGNINIKISDTPCVFNYAAAKSAQIVWYTNGIQNSGIEYLFGANTGSTSFIYATANNGKIVLDSGYTYTAQQ